MQDVAYNIRPMQCSANHLGLCRVWFTMLGFMQGVAYHTWSCEWRSDECSIQTDCCKLNYTLGIQRSCYHIQYMDLCTLRLYAQRESHIPITHRNIIQPRSQATCYYLTTIFTTYLANHALSICIQCRHTMPVSSVWYGGTRKVEITHRLINSLLPVHKPSLTISLVKRIF